MFFITKLDDVDDFINFEDVKKELIEDLEHNEYDLTLYRMHDGNNMVTNWTNANE